MAADLVTWEQAGEVLTEARITRVEWENANGTEGANVYLYLEDGRVVTLRANGYDGADFVTYVGHLTRTA